MAAKGIRSAIRHATRTTTTQSSVPGAEASVLLIGSTGNGKSTLGNFILDPDETVTTEIFETATDNMPKTQNSRSVTGTFHSDKYSSIMFTVIDTPGLNEGAEKDLKHMADLIKQLQQIKEITACIFVVKFESKIDIQYKATIKYYAKLLPALFEKNVFVVMTAYATDDISIARRKKQKINEEQMQTNVIREIIDCADLDYNNLHVFKLDCVPLCDEQKLTSMAIRNDIIDYVLSLESITLTNLTVAKTDYLLAIDNIKINEYEGTIIGYKERLQESNRLSEKALNKVHQKEKQVADSQQRMKSIKLELAEKDTVELVTAATWSVDSEWKWFQTQEKGYQLSSPFKICNVRKWTNGKCELEDKLQTDTKLEGVVLGSFMRGLHANITAETQKCLKYAAEIKQLKNDLEFTKAHCSVQEKELCGYREEYKEYVEEIQSFENFIEQKRKLIVKLSGDRMTIEEAYARLKDIHNAQGPH